MVVHTFGPRRKEKLKDKHDLLDKRSTAELNKESSFPKDKLEKSKKEQKTPHKEKDKNFKLMKLK